MSATGKLIAVAICILLGTQPVKAQNFNIVAIVNDESISNFEIFDRMILAIKSSGISDSKEIRSRLFPKTLQVLINEKLQAQEAEKLGIRVTDDDMQKAIRSIEDKNSLGDGEFNNFVKSQGINKDSLLNQLIAQIIWKKIESRKITPLISVSDFEVEDALAQLKNSKKVEEIYLSEIFLSIEDDSHEKEVMDLAHKLVKEIKDGADFGNIAREFSLSSSASRGGVLGWVAGDNLKEDIRYTVKNTEPDNITDPIKVSGGVRILNVGDKRVRNNIIDAGQIREFLIMQKIDMESRRFTKSLRDKAFIEIKL